MSKITLLSSKSCLGTELSGDAVMSGKGLCEKGPRSVLLE